MSNTVSLEQLRGKIDQEVAVSDWMTVDQERINLFADATGDHQFIHVDPEAAANTPFGGTIAHGFLTLSLVSKFAAEVMPRLEGAVMGINYGLNKVRFLAPVKTGQSLRGRFTLLKVEERKPGEILSTFSVTMEIQGENTPACVIELLGLTILGS